MDSASIESPVWAAAKADWAEVARFFARVIGTDPAYISHGEIQTGLSLDGKTWAPNLEERFLAELGDFNATRGVCFMRGAGGEIAAAANVTWSLENADAPFATLQDVAVDPAMRSAGLGDRLLRFVENEAVKRGARWIFLESGKNNHDAHAFFERRGYAEVSRVYMKSCSVIP